MTKIIAKINGERYLIELDLSQASAPIYVDGSPTPYQTADARHTYRIAVALGLRHVGAAELPACPAPMTPDEWDHLIGDYPDWDEVEYWERSSARDIISTRSKKQ